MANYEDFIQLSPLSFWPPNVHLKSQNGLSEIFYSNKTWKTVAKNYLLEDIRIKNEESIFWKYKSHFEAYNEEILVIGYNIFMPDTEILVCRTTQVANQLKSILMELKNGYESRVQTAKERWPRKWCNLGSDVEVLEESVQSTREKISVEWIGNLEKQRANRTAFADVEPEDLANGCVEFTVTQPEQDIFEVKQKTQLDIGVQADVILREQIIQTDVHKLLDQFSSQSSDEGEEVAKIDELLEGPCETEKQSNLEESTSEHLIINDGELNYFKSFIHVENRFQKISDIAWHPTRQGYIAIAYRNKLKSDSIEDLFAVKCAIKKTPLISKKYEPVNEDDVKINGPVFDIMFKKQEKVESFDANDVLSESSDQEKESEDEETDIDLKKNSKLVQRDIYGQEMAFHRPSASIFSKTEIPADHEITIEDEWIAKYLAMQKELDEAPSALPAQTSSDESEKSDRSTSSGESVSEFFRNRSPILGVPLCEDEISSDSSLCEDDLPITDTDGCVLVWNCNNDLFPQSKLTNSHDITVIKFCPHDGDVLAGGSSSGQLILWMGLFETNGNFARKDSSIVRKFLENFQFCETDDQKYRSMSPTIVSERNISHLYPITDLQWMHPSLTVSSNGRLVESADVYSKQIFTSSTDGSVKVWNLHMEEAIEQINWNLQLIYNMLVNDFYLEKYSIPVRMFEIFTPSIKYARNTSYTEDSVYSYVSELNSKFKPVLILANGVGEVGVVRWPEKQADEADAVVGEKCKHEWWGICHDDAITSMSKNYFFPNIILTTGGRVFAVWNIEYKKGPIWWQQYSENVSISGGVFTPFHPGIMYISRADGQIDIWNINKQLHKPVREWKATGYSVSVLSVATPPSSYYQLGIADTNGNFHILRNRYDTTWNEEDILRAGQFFKHAEKNRKQLVRWNRTWMEHSTVTDVYGFERTPRAKNFRKMSQRNKKMEEQRSISAKMMETDDGILEKVDFVNRVIQSEEFKSTLNDIQETVKATRQVDAYSKTKEDILARVQQAHIENLSADQIFEKYCHFD